MNGWNTSLHTYAHGARCDARMGRSTNFQAYACAARAVGGVRVQTGCARVCVWTWIAKLNLPEASQNHFFPRIFFSKKDWNMMYAWKM